jgi:hypothetical protein
MRYDRAQNLERLPNYIPGRRHGIRHLITQLAELSMRVRCGITTALFAEPLQVKGRSLVKAAVSDLPHIGTASLVVRQKQAPGTIPVVVNRGHRGQLGDLLAEPRKLAFPDVTAVEQIQRPVERRRREGPPTGVEVVTVPLDDLLGSDSLRESNLKPSANRRAHSHDPHYRAACRVRSCRRP